jgi:DNA-directed RNA polymerase subunit RPC12/RpoP
MTITFQQKCFKCKKNFVTITNRQRYVICYDCQKAQLSGEIKSPKMKKLFSIPEEYYRKNSFLRDIKAKYMQFGELSEKQIEAFKKTVQKYDEEAKTNRAGKMTAQ